MLLCMSGKLDWEKTSLENATISPAAAVGC